MDKKELLAKVRRTFKHADESASRLRSMIEREAWGELVEPALEDGPSVMVVPGAVYHVRGEVLGMLAQYARDSHNLELATQLATLLETIKMDVGQSDHAMVCDCLANLMLELSIETRDQLFYLAARSLPSKALANLTQEGVAPSRRMEEKIRAAFGGIAGPEIRALVPAWNAVRLRERLASVTRPGLTVAAISGL